MRAVILAVLLSGCVTGPRGPAGAPCYFDGGATVDGVALAEDVTLAADATSLAAACSPCASDVDCEIGTYCNHGWDGGMCIHPKGGIECPQQSYHP